MKFIPEEEALNVGRVRPISVMSDFPYEPVDIGALRRTTGPCLLLLEGRDLRPAENPNKEPYHCVIGNVGDITPGQGPTRIAFRCYDNTNTEFIGFVTETGEGCVTHFVGAAKGRVKESPPQPTAPIVISNVDNHEPPPHESTATGRFRRIPFPGKDKLTGRFRRRPSD